MSAQLNSLRYVAGDLVLVRTTDAIVRCQTFYPFVVNPDWVHRSALEGLMYMRLSMAVLFLGSVCGCSDPVALPPDDFELPPPDLSLDPASLEVGELVTSSCGPGDPSGPGSILDRDEWATVDIFFPSQAESLPGPSLEHLSWIRSVRGRVLHEFNVPAVRARVIGSRIPDLVKPGRFVWVRTVPNAARYDVPVSVTYTAPPTVDDAERFELLGGRVQHSLTVFPRLWGTLPDRSIPDLRLRTGVVSVDAEGIACLVVQ